jgi:hypothetical protein
MRIGFLSLPVSHHDLRGHDWTSNFSLVWLSFSEPISSLPRMVCERLGNKPVKGPLPRIGRLSAICVGCTWLYMVAHTAYEGRGSDPICQFHLDIRVTSALFSTVMKRSTVY